MRRNRFLQLRLFTFLVCLLSLTYAKAQNVTIDGINYYLFPDTREAAINNKNTCSGELIIPSEVNYGGETYIVTGMSDMAFDGCELTKVRIPKTINHFVNGALSDEPLCGSSSNRNPFIRCTALELIEVDEDNPIMSSEGGILYNKDKTWLYCYPAGMRQETFVIPDNVTKIGSGAIGYNQYLISLIIPNSVTDCGYFCRNCVNLKTVRLSDHITNISAYAFEFCESLKSIEIPNGVTYMGEGVFRWCSSLESIVLPDNISFVGSYAFRACTSLETVKLSSSLKRIENGMFYGCSKLKTVVIPDEVTDICPDVFQQCSSLTELDLPTSVTTIGANAFKGCKFNHLIIRGKIEHPNRFSFEGLDTSTTIYTPASQVEEIKKIYDGVVLSLEDYTSGIRPTTYSSDNLSPAYDPQGRRLTGKPAKGLYIQNGRKIIGK